MFDVSRISHAQVQKDFETAYEIVECIYAQANAHVKHFDYLVIYYLLSIKAIIYFFRRNHSIHQMSQAYKIAL